MVVDCAIMCLNRQRFTKAHADDQAAAYYVYTDSSPQGRYNWQISSYDMVGPDDLPEVADMMYALWGLGPSLVREPNDDDAATEASLVSRLHDKIVRMFFIPTALGSHHAKVTNKLQAFLHSLYMDTGPPPLWPKHYAVRSHSPRITAQKQA